MGLSLCTIFAALAIGKVQTYNEATLIKLAKDTITATVLGKPMPAPVKGSPKPVFVTIEVNGFIRGCRGSLATRSKSLGEEVSAAAESACAHDPRYKPLLPSELDRFLVTVTIVERSEPITSVSGLRLGDGLALKSGDRWGIVLPWEGKDLAVRLRWAYTKAGVAQGSAAQLYRLTATRFRG